MPRSSKKIRTLADVGESALIERIARRAGLASTHDWVAGIGDDAAILRPRRGQELVFSADAQIEGIHFRFGRESARQIGRRALAVNLSDLAAMGANPVGSLLSLAAPADFPLSDFDGLIAGFVGEGDRFGCPLVGGNLSRAAQCSLHVTVIGRVRTGRALRRGQLGAGDVLYVTGELGRAALARLRADATKSRLRHVPTPRLEAGQKLAASKATSACIDLSDGLATDLRHLLADSALGAKVDVDALPVSRGHRRACEALGLDPVEVTVAGGEDYELLFARRPVRGRELGDESAGLSASLGVRVTRIGQVNAGGGVQGIAPPSQPHHF